MKALVKTKKRRIFLITTIVIVVVLLLLRLCVFDVVKIPSDSKCPKAGKTALVSRWSYGFRLPWNTAKRISYKPATRNDWVTFNPPVSSRGEKLNKSITHIGRVAAAPGDTVWYNNDSGSISLEFDERNGFVYPLIVPVKDKSIAVTNGNIQFYKTTIMRHEPVKAEIVEDSLCVSGKIVSSYSFQQDYYWIVTDDPKNSADSRTFGFVPHSTLIGKIL